MSNDVDRLIAGLTELSEFCCRFGWHFHRLDVTVLAFAYIMYIRGQDLGRQTG